MPFADRQHAAHQLAQRLKAGRYSNPLVIALPRGGVPIGAEVAHQLKAHLEILVVRKIGAPGNPEYGIGAVTEHGYLWIDAAAARASHATTEEVERIVAMESLEVERRIKRYRGSRHRYRVRGKTVILVDDGLATGATARVAARFLREQGAAEIVLAVPVCPLRSLQSLAGEVDETICLESPEEFGSVSQFYEDFPQVSDEQVVNALAKTRPKRALDQLGLSEEIEITDGALRLPGHLNIPSQAHGIVIFAHGTGSGKLSHRNLEVARFLNQGGVGTLLFDLLTPTEALSRTCGFDIPFLSRRLNIATRWLRSRGITRHFPLAYFGASTGAGAALWSTAELGHEISAVVSRGGRPDLARPRLIEIMAPTLLIVGGEDTKVLELNQRAAEEITESELFVVPGATHLFEEEGAMDTVSRQALAWFLRHFSTSANREAA